MPPAVASQPTPSFPETREDREAVGFAEIESMSRGFIADSLRHLETELQALVLDAQKAADAFWATVEEARQDGEKPGFLGTRVRLKNGTLEAVWYRNRFYSGPKEKGEKARFFSDHIRKGSGPSYPKATFNKCPAWERQVCEMVEARYTNLRERAALLTNMRTSLRVYERLTNKCYQHEA